jgi:hypothetical protein
MWRIGLHRARIAVALVPEIPVRLCLAPEQILSMFDRQIGAGPLVGKFHFETARVFV